MISKEKELMKQLGELYYKNDGVLSSEDLKLERKILDEIISIRKIERVSAVEPNKKSDSKASESNKVEIKENKESIVEPVSIKTPISSKSESEKSIAVVQPKEIGKSVKFTDSVAKRNKAKRILFASAATILIVTLIGLSAKNCKKSKNDIVNAKPTNTPTSISILTSTPTVEPTVTPEIEKLFTDVKHIEQLDQRVKEIYGIQIDDILKELEDNNLNSYITEDKLIDLILVSLGELPISEEYNPNTVGETIQFRTEVFGNLGSDPRLDKIYPSYYSYLAPEGTQLNEYMDSYDVIYNDIAKYRNENSMDQVITSIKSLSIKLYNEYVLAGLYGGYNPYNFDYEHRSLALGSAIERYAAYALEYIQDNHLTICVPVCINPETDQMQEVNVIEIYEAILKGKSKLGNIQMDSLGSSDIKLSKVFYEELKEALEYKNSLTLKKGVI